MSALTPELSANTVRATFRRDAKEVVGHQVDAAGSVRGVTGVRLVLVRDSSQEGGLRLLTSFPTHIAPGESAEPDYPALDLLFGAYLNQEWPHHYRDWRPAVAHWVAESPGWAPLALAELNALLTCADTHVAAVLERCDCGYDAEDLRGWLAELAAFLRTTF